MTFSEFKLHPALDRAVNEMGYAQPTAIQRDAMPPALAGRDVLACAQTGSGKTAAFMLPILHRLAGRGRGGPRALILSPTRELAAQLDEHRYRLGRHIGVTGAAVYGGVGMVPQERAFRSGVQVMVATPGRLLDHLSRSYARLDQVEVLVLDEADRMLDMGFLPDIREIIGLLPVVRQTMMFSATMPRPIVELSSDILRDPVTLNIDRSGTPADGITHAAYAIPQALKMPLLLHLLGGEEMSSAVVFTRTKHRADRLADYLEENGVRCGLIHGNRSQSQRTEALRGFRRGAFRVLVATDVAARGLDVEALSHVVNFDTPAEPEDYIHRVGRTARAEATGDAVTLVAPDEERNMRQIERALGARIPRLAAEGFSKAAVQPVAPERPLAERITEIRARKAEERVRAAANAAAREARYRRTTDGFGHSTEDRGAGRGFRPAQPGATAPQAPAARSGRRFRPVGSR